MADEPAPEGEEMVWVRTQPSASGKTYVVSIDFTDDLSVTLKPSEAAAYAAAVLAAGMYAAHDAAVLVQLTELGLTTVEAAGAIRTLRDSRAPVPTTGTALALEPGVTAEGKPFLVILLAGEREGQWTVADARTHAQHVLEAVHAADLDAAYRRYLVGTVGLDEATAIAAVNDLVGRVQ